MATAPDPLATAAQAAADANYNQGVAAAFLATMQATVAALQDRHAAIDQRRATGNLLPADGGDQAVIAYELQSISPYLADAQAAYDKAEAQAQAAAALAADAAASTGP